MDGRFQREEGLIGTERLRRLAAAHVIVFGAGGVGGMVIEQLARCGVGALTIVDGDVFGQSNLNRQILAVESTLGVSKAQAAADRVRSINPNCKVTAVPLYFEESTADSFDFTAYDFVADAIDMVTWKIKLIRRAKEAGTPLISSMGTGNKLDPTALCITDLSKTAVCPLARVMRKELKRRGITEGVTVVYSTEEAHAPQSPECVELKANGRPAPGSISFVPNAAGLLMAAHIVRELMGELNKD